MKLDDVYQKPCCNAAMIDLTMALLSDQAIVFLGAYGFFDRQVETI